MKNKYTRLLVTKFTLQPFWALGLLFLSALFPSLVWAQCTASPVIGTFESCAGPGKTNCKTTNHVISWNVVCPPPPPPVAPPPPPPVSPQPPKSADEIEREVHVKFCKEFPAEIDLAVQRCQNQALGYQSYFISSQCPKGGGTWSLGFSLAKAVTVNFSKNVSAADCRAEAEANLKYYQDSCRLSGNEHLHVVKQLCSDVP